jgi:hypothetical protein
MTLAAGDRLGPYEVVAPIASCAAPREIRIILNWLEEHVLCADRCYHAQ